MFCIKATKRICLYIGVLLAGVIPAAAQVYSLDSCRNMAIRTNKELKMADHAIEGAGYARKAAYAAYLPGIDFTGMYMYNQNKIQLLGEDAKLPTMKFNPATGKYDYNILVNPATGQPVTDPKTGSVIPTEVAVIPKEAMSYDVHNVFGGAVTLTQPVYMGGALRAMNEITKYAEEMARSSRNAAVQELVYAVDEAYWTVVSLENKRKLAVSFVNLVDTLRHNVDEMVRVGVATKSDALKVQVRYNEAELALTKVDNGLSLSRMALAQICGLPINTQMMPEDVGLYQESKKPRAMNIDMEEVYASRQDLETMRHGIKLSEQNARLSKAAMLPKVAIVGMYAFSNPNVIDGFEKRFGGGFSVGATVTVPLWHWGLNYNKYRVAKSQTKVQELLLADAEDKVELQVKQARFRYEEAFKTYDMTVVNEKNADENLRQAQLGFHEGVLTTEDVIAAQTAWLSAHSEKIDAEIGIALCRVYLAKVLGNLEY